jgi:hypothetical protein
MSGRCDRPALGTGFDGTFIALAPDGPSMSETDGNADGSSWRTGMGALAFGMGGGIVAGSAIGVALGQPMLWLGIGIALGVVVTAGLLSVFTDED